MLIIKRINGGVDKNGKIIPDGHRDYDWVGDIQLNIVNTDRIAKAIFLGTTPTIWGHYINNGLSKVWFCQTERFSGLIENGYEILMVGLFGNPSIIPQPLKELFQLIQIPIERIHFVTKPIRVDSIVIPDNSQWMTNNGINYTSEFCKTVQSIINATPVVKLPNKYKKIFLSRNGFKGSHKEFGNRDLEFVFEKAGFHIIHPEKMTVADQINLLRQAKHVVATEGSIAHNVLFCSLGTEVTIIRKAFYTNNYQYAINQMRKLNVTYVDAHLSLFLIPGRPVEGSFFMYVNYNVVKYLKERFGISVKNSFCWLKYLNYIRISLARKDFSMKMHNSIPDEYFQKMSEEFDRSMHKYKSHLSILR